MTTPRSGSSCSALPRRLTAVVILVLSALLAAMRPASADVSWADLLKRVVGERAREPYGVVVGRVPDGFTYPAGIQPDLPILGATYFAVLPGTPPDVHVYYAPSASTNEAVAALVRQLVAAHFVQRSEYGYVNAFVGDVPPGESWCSTEHRGYMIQFAVRDADRVPALDIRFWQSGLSACDHGGVYNVGEEASVPVLRDIPGIQIFAGMRRTESREHSLGSFAVIRTSVPAADALGRLAEPFTAAGWTPRPPVNAGGALLQHFSRVQGSFRFTAVLLIQPRSGSTTLYDAALDVTRDLIGDSAR